MTDLGSKPAATPNADAIAEWIAAWLARELPMPIEEIDRDESLDSYGVSSLLIVTMSGELEDLLGYPVDPSVVYDYPTINELAAHFATGQGAQP